MTKDEIKDKLYALHGASSRNLEQVKKSTTCGCFCCGSIFKNEDIGSPVTMTAREIGLQFVLNAMSIQFWAMPVDMRSHRIF